MTPRIPALIAAATLAVVGCSSGDDETSATTAEATADTTVDTTADTTTAPTTTEPSTTTEAPAPSTAATTTEPDAEFAAWCTVAVEVDELSDQSDLVDYTDPVAVEEYLRELVPALESAAQQAPDEIADAVATSADIAGQLRDALADADYDMLTADLSLIDELDDERDAAQDTIRAFNAEQCGLEFDDEVTEPDDDFSFSDGSLRDQFIGQLVASGFTLPEAACIFEEMDFAAADSMDDPAVLLPIFETCGIDTQRLEEIGATATPGLSSNDLLATSLMAIGLDEEQIECVVTEIEAMPPSAVDEDLVMSTMLGCGVSLDQLTNPDFSSAGELEDLYVDQFMAMGLAEDDARCLHDELLVGNIDGFTADDVLTAMESCGIDPAALG